ncbi:hypothetical protein TIFTF001_008955 [Ficus carica]|uniref:Uncharacterized protein n=1 Tax=Ficus carica TaxID=3494 RepID=A0AA88D0Z1_FICCA|nr:hypothetical protein TIFTF001_008955 [Ficus carica]
MGGSTHACMQANCRGCSFLVASIELARKKALSTSHRRVKPSLPPTLASYQKEVGRFPNGPVDDSTKKLKRTMQWRVVNIVDADAVTKGIVTHDRRERDEIFAVVSSQL